MVLCRQQQWTLQQQLALLLLQKQTSRVQAPVQSQLLLQHLLRFLLRKAQQRRL